MALPYSITATLYIGHCRVGTFPFVSVCSPEDTKLQYIYHFLFCFKVKEEVGGKKSVKSVLTTDTLFLRRNFVSINDMTLKKQQRNQKNAERNGLIRKTESHKKKDSKPGYSAEWGTHMLENYLS